MKIPGAVSFSPTSNANNTDFHADNVLFFSAVSDTGGITGNLEMALFPNTFLRDVLGWAIADNGGLVQLANQPHPPFALLFEVAGNEEPIRVVYYNCVGSTPTDSHTTNTQNITVATKSMAISATPILLPNQRWAPRYSLKKSDSEADFANFFTQVIVPSITVTGGTGGASGTVGTMAAGATLTGGTDTTGKKG
jgi:phi13 family phage major tail protein